MNKYLRLFLSQNLLLSDIFLRALFIVFGHIIKVSFDNKYIKNIDSLIFIIENRTVFFVFSVTAPSIRENRVKMSICANFRIKVTKKWQKKS